MLTAEDGEVTTVVVDPYLVTPSNPGLGVAYEGSLQFTGEIHYLTPNYLVRMELPNNQWIIFDMDDALELKGPTE